MSAEFWRLFELVAPSGAASIVLKKRFPEVYEQFRKLSRPHEPARWIPDLDDNVHSLELDPLENGNYLATSREVPSHRPPFEVPCEDAMILVPDLVKITEWLVSTLRFSPNWKDTWIGRFKEVGIFDGAQLEPVYFYVPGNGLRSVEMVSGLNAIYNATVLIPTVASIDFQMRQLAEKQRITVHVLETGNQLTTKLVRGRKKGISTKKSRFLFKTDPAATWGDAVIVVEENAISFRVADKIVIKTFKEMGLRPNDTKIVTLGKLASQDWRRLDDAERQRIHRLTEWLCGLLNIRGKPIRKSKKGYLPVFQLAYPKVRQAIEARNSFRQFDDAKALEEMGLDIDRMSVHGM
jgi:hypothetical protein